MRLWRRRQRRVRRDERASSDTPFGCLRGSTPQTRAILTPCDRISSVATFEDLLDRWDGEQAVIHRDRESEGWIFICMHSTQLGPSAGGTRMKVYGTPADGLQDAMRLS